MPRDKVNLTKKLIELLPEDQKITSQQAMNMWWFNLRKNGGMRLTGLGYATFVKALELEHYQFAIKDPMLFNQQTILSMDRKLQTPYYIHAVKGVPKMIVFFGSREAVMVNLYGDLNKFIDNYKV